MYDWIISVFYSGDEKKSRELAAYVYTLLGFLFFGAYFCTAQAASRTCIRLVKFARHSFFRGSRGVASSLNVFRYIKLFFFFFSCLMVTGGGGGALRYTLDEFHPLHT